jgi:ribosome assembly protein RRB1
MMMMTVPIFLPLLIYVSFSCSDMDIDQPMPPIEETEEQDAPSRPFIPGTDTLAADEVLEPDESVYLLRHTMGVDWPCLSFDVLRDNLGDERQRFPMVSYIVAGTQADSMNKNQVVVYKISNLYKTQRNNSSFPIHPCLFPLCLHIE